MPLAGIIFDGEKIPLNQCVDFANINYSKYPPEIVAGMVAFNSEEREAITVTSLLDCPRALFLSRLNDYYENYSHLFWSFRGQLGHILAEKFAKKGAIVEKRYYRTIAGITISGKPDTIYPKEGMIRDFKTTNALPKYGKPWKNHPPQLNAYRYLLAKPDNDEPIEINQLLVTYFTMKDTVTVEAPLEDLDKVEATLLAKASILKYAFDNKQIPDVPEEYPTYWKCNGYCPMAKECAKIWKMGQKG